MTRRILSWFTLRPDRPRGDCQDFGDLSRFPAIQFSESGAVLSASRFRRFVTGEVGTLPSGGVGVNVFFLSL